MLGIAVEPVRDHILEAYHIDPETKIWRTIQIAKTWVIIVVGELFFRANGLKAGWYMFCSMIKNFDVGQLTDGTLYTLGLERADYLAVIVGCLIVGSDRFYERARNLCTEENGRTGCTGALGIVLCLEL